MSRRRRRRHDRRDRSATGEVLTGVLELGDVIGLVLSFVVRIPLLLLRLLV